MFIFGWGFKTVKRYGYIGKHLCKECQRETDWHLVKVTTWFTLFFIPVIPTNIKRMIICTKCNAGRIINKDMFQQLVQKIEKGEIVENGQNLQYQNMTDTQKNYMQEMEAYRKSQDENQRAECDKHPHDKLIRKSPYPMTREKIAEELRNLGLQKGMTVLVHGSMSSIGWISGGPVSVIQGLMDVITEEGTIVMPAHTADYSDPTHWENPAVPSDWIEPIKASMPAYDCRYTPTCGMGVIAESFRNFPDVMRSNHPQVSFAAWGKHATIIVEDHALDYGLGNQSPIAKLYDLGGRVLLLGVEYDSNTSFHLAEYRVSKKKEVENTSPILVGDETKWVVYKDIDLDTDDFDQIGTAMEEAGKMVTGQVGQATARFMNQRDAVDFACRWMEENR